jgi:hypothetical protein
MARTPTTAPDLLSVWALGLYSEYIFIETEFDRDKEA